ncbi:MAG TPA: hypothetical protein VJB13_05055 [Candidatus Nanoarchaeia archaeon]|nr:hypothetical protein [Candidatus Nanoarchaeia archaeon]
MKLVYVESPFKGENWELTARNVYYARLCVRDCLKRGEAPYASHLFFTQAGILNDAIQAERDLGIAAGQSMGDKFDLRVVYEDFGISKGMQYGIERALKLGQPIEHRKLSVVTDLDKALQEMAAAKPHLDLGGLLF